MLDQKVVIFSRGKYNLVMECDKCGSVDFHEQDGFYFCIHCQTQSQVSFFCVLSFQFMFSLLEGFR